MRSEWRALVREIEAAGYRVEMKGRKHPSVVTLDGKYVLPLPGTPGDHRSLANTRRDLKRAGVFPPTDRVAA